MLVKSAVANGVILAGLMTAFNCAAASDIARDIYYGAGVGHSHYSKLEQVEGRYRKNNPALNAFTGYKINDYFAAELGYFHAGQGRAADETFNSQGLTYSIIGQEKIYKDVALQLEAGGIWARSRGFGESDSKMASLLGAALLFPITDELSLRTRWRYMRNVSHLPMNSQGETFKHNQNIASLELIYQPSFKVAEPVVEPIMPEPVIEAPVVAPVVFPEMVRVLFDFASSQLNAQAKGVLDKLVTEVLALGDEVSEITVMGHADIIGSSTSAKLLSEKRANVVLAYLMDRGLPASKAHTIALGNSEPITAGKCDSIRNNVERKECLRQDRRVEVRVF